MPEDRTALSPVIRYLRRCIGYESMMTVLQLQDYPGLQLNYAGGTVTFHLYTGMIHGFFSCSRVLDQGNALRNEIGRDVTSAMG